MYSDLVRAGAEVVANDTIQLDFDGLFVDRRFDWRQDEFGRAEHRKLYVIDGTLAWTGGAGIQDHFANGRFHDVMARVTGDVVRQAQAVFLTALPRLRRPRARRPRLRTSRHSPNRARCRPRSCRWSRVATSRRRRRPGS